MKWNELSNQDCSLARSLAVIGDRWTLLVLRDAFLRVRRFDDFQASTGIARRVLAERLAKLVDEGMFEKRRYNERPIRYEYWLTPKGLDFYPAILALVHWGDRHYGGEDGPPLLHRHKACGHIFQSKLCCSVCDAEVGARDVTVETRAAPTGKALSA